jgi:hypothetical protein
LFEVETEWFLCSPICWIAIVKSLSSFWNTVWKHGWETVFFFKNLIFVFFILFLYINVKNNFLKIKKYYFNIFLIKKN